MIKREPITRLRWVVPASTSTKQPVLQYCPHHIDAPKDAEVWFVVPTVVLEDEPAVRHTQVMSVGTKPDKPRFHVVRPIPTSGGQPYIQDDDDFTHDSALTVKGYFESTEEKASYLEKLAELLNRGLQNG